MLWFTFQKAVLVGKHRLLGVRRTVGVPNGDTPHQVVDAPGLPM